MIIFAYGSLKRRQNNHRYLVRAPFLGLARTEPLFTLYDLGAYPAIVDGGSTRVEGEIYDVDHATLRTLDRIEGHPTFYRRVPIVLSEPLRCEGYVLPAALVRDGVVIAAGRWPA